jgi:TonB family protein
MKRKTVLLALLVLGLGAFTSSNATINKSLTDTFLQAEGEDKKAQFPGGNEAFMKYMKENLRYPKDAKRYGKVIVEFTVKKNGKCKDFNIKKGVSEILDYSAVETLQGMPIWEPAVKDGKKVESKMTLPVYFKPDEDADQKKEESEKSMKKG